MTPAEQGYYFDMIIVGLGLFYFLYVVYGRLKKRPLVKPIVGDYRPGTAEHAVFMQFIHNNWISSAVALAMILALADAVVNGRELLKGSGPHSVLAEAPIIVGISIIVLVAIASLISRGKS